jgi:hypothetical protein
MAELPAPTKLSLGPTQFDITTVMLCFLASRFNMLREIRWNVSSDRTNLNE